MSNIVMKFYYNGFNFEYKGKPMSVLEIRQTKYIPTEDDFSSMLGELDHHSALYDEIWRTAHVPTANYFIEVLQQHAAFMLEWNELRDVEVNDYAEICSAFKHFNVGDDICEVWQYLEEKYPLLRVADYL